MKHLLLFCVCLIFSFADAQINPERITIVRDQWGIPHIYAPTDAEVAYGLAWATAEDDFYSMQMQMLAVKGMLGLALGKEGAFMDVAVHLLGAHQIVEDRYEQDLSPGFREVLEAYAAGANAYAQSHPEEVLLKKAFPISGKDIIKGYVVGVAQMTGVEKSLRQILGGKLELPAPAEAGPAGSNAFAVSRRRTTDGKTYLAINSHQPLEGPTAWYEVHLCSEEGMNLMGATFPGGATIFLGTNEYLGWGHTLNYPDLSDIYQLHMHPTEKLTYRFDGQWIKLQPYYTKARIKAMGFLRLGAKQKFYQSKYGVTFETPQGFFSLRFPANRDIRAAEQWFRMGKATNFEEFMQALNMQGHIGMNLVYADREDHLFYISNGRFPIRDPHYDWKGVLPGDTSATLWQDQYYPLDSLPHVLDPPSGFVYNCNQTPFLASGPGDHPDPARTPATTGYQAPEYDNNRSVRLRMLMQQHPTLSYEDFKRIKFDRAYHTPLLSARKLEAIFHLDEAAYPQVAESIRLLKSWDRVTRPESEAASIFLLVLRHLGQKIPWHSLDQGDELTTELLIEALEQAQQHLLTHFGKVAVPLGDMQRHQRGQVDLPIGGGPDVLAAIHTRPIENGRFKARAGDSYISLVRFSSDGVEIESLNAYGSSAKPGSPHYTDQMQPFVQQQLRPMTLEREKIFKEAERIYHPR